MNPLRPIRLALLLLVFAARATGAQPAPGSELHAAVADAARLPASVVCNARYLSLYAVPENRRDEVTRVTNYTLNALSRVRAMPLAVKVSPTLLRIDASGYVADAKQLDEWTTAWGALADQDSYFHLQTEVLDPISGSRRTVTVPGGWTNLADAERLQCLTGSHGALIRADQFVYLATSTPLYYQFAGIPDDLDGFYKLLGVDQATVTRLHSDMGANLGKSGITKKTRRIVWGQGALGSVWGTLDVKKVDATRDPIRRAISTSGYDLTFDASEYFGMKADGLWATALYDAAGKLQQAVPPDVAADTSEPQAPDAQVIPMVSCIRCHADGGLQSFSDDQARLLRRGGDVLSYDPTVTRRIAEFYDEPTLQDHMTSDRRTYTRAVAKCTGGMTPEQLSEALARTVREFQFVSVDMHTAALEAGIGRPGTLSIYLPVTSDPVLIQILQGQPVHRDRWASSFQEAALAARRPNRP